MHHTLFNAHPVALLAACALLAGHGLAQAQAQTPWQSDGGNTVKVGAIRYQTHATTTGITGLGVPAGAEVQINSATTALLTLERAISPTLGVELVLGLPPTVRAHGSGSVGYLGEVQSARNVAPTLLLNYHFGEPGSTLRPYLGLGVNYTHFSEARTPYGWEISLSDSWGWAAQLGLDYSLNKQWGLFASVGAAKVKSDLVAIGASVLRTTIDFRPITYAAGLSYRF